MRLLEHSYLVLIAATKDPIGENVGPLISIPAGQGGVRHG